MKIISTFSILIPLLFILISDILLIKTFAADNKWNEAKIISEPEIKISPKFERHPLNHVHPQVLETTALERTDPYYHLHLPEKLQKALLEKGYPISKLSHADSREQGLQELRTGYVVPSRIHHKHYHPKRDSIQGQEKSTLTSHSPTFLNSDGLQQHKSGWAIHKPFYDEDENGEGDGKKKRENPDSKPKEYNIPHLPFLGSDSNSLHHSRTNIVHVGLGPQKHKPKSQKELDDFFASFKSPKKSEKDSVEQGKESKKK